MERFPTKAELTAISVAYRNRSLIADEVLPRYPVGTKTYEYEEFDLATGFTIPNTMVGRFGQPNQLHIPSTIKEGNCRDWGLSSPIPVDDIKNREAGEKLEARTTEILTDIIQLDREVRVAQLVHNPATYLPSNVLTPTLPWTDPDATPIADIQAGIKACLFRANTLVFGRDLFDLFACHPKVVKSCNRNDGGEGVARARDIAELFQVDKVLIGDALVNIKRHGQPPELHHAWGKKLALIYLDNLGGPKEKPSFGFTAEYDGRVAGSAFDKDIGLRGGIEVRVGETVDERIACPALGALIDHP